MQASRPRALLAPLAAWPRSADAPSVRIAILTGHSLSSDQMQLFYQMNFQTGEPAKSMESHVQSHVPVTTVRVSLVPMLRW